MGEKQSKPFQLSFDGSLKVDFQGSRVTSDGGLILIRELDERLGLGKLIEEHLSDSRQGSNKKFPLADLLRQSVYSRLAGYEDLNDAIRVSADPTFRLIGSKKNWDRGGALTSRRQSFEAELLASEENLLGLMAVNRELVAQAEAAGRVPSAWVLDMDSTESPVHGQQEGSAYNGHFESVCYHPLATVQPARRLSCCEVAPRQRVQRRGTGDELLLPEIERQQAEGKRVTFRADAAFAKPELYDASSKSVTADYVIRIPANKNLELEIEDILFRPLGRPSTKPLVRYKSFRYQAASWSKSSSGCRQGSSIISGELFPCVGFIVTNMSLAKPVAWCASTTSAARRNSGSRKANRRPTGHRLSCHCFRANEVRLQLSVLAYNLGNLWRRLGLPQQDQELVADELQQRLVKTGGRLIQHARYYWLMLLAEGYLNRRLFGDMLRRIWALPVPGWLGPSRSGRDLGVEEGGSERCVTNRLSSSETGSPDDKNWPWEPFDAVVACLTRQSRCIQEKRGSTLFESKFQIEILAQYSSHQEDSSPAIYPFKQHRESPVWTGSSEKPGDRELREIFNLWARRAS